MKGSHVAAVPVIPKRSVFLELPPRRKSPAQGSAWYPAEPEAKSNIKAAAYARVAAHTSRTEHA